MKKLAILFLLLVFAMFGCSSGGQSNSEISPSENNSSNTESNSSESGEMDESGMDSIKIGALYNITGGQASLDGPTLKGAELAVKEINEKGGIDGKEIKLVTVDAKSDPTTATNGMQELIEVEEVSAVAGFSDTTFTLAAGPIAQEAGVPFITSGATSPLIPDQVGDNMFMLAFGDDAQAAAISDYALNELGVKTAWVLTDTSSDFTLGLSKFFQEHFVENGGEIVLKDEYDGATDVDFSAQITRLKSLGKIPDALFVSALPDKAGIVVKQIRDMGIDAPVISADGFDTPALVEMGGVPQTNNVYFSTHVSLDNPDELVQHFVNEYEKSTGNYPENGFAALGYDVVYLLADAIGRADSTEPAAIREAIAQTDGFKGVTGEISYKEGRVPKKSIAIIRVNEGTFEYTDTWEPK